MLEPRSYTHQGHTQTATETQMQGITKTGTGTVLHPKRVIYALKGFPTLRGYYIRPIRKVHIR